MKYGDLFHHVSLYALSLLLLVICAMYYYKHWIVLQTALLISSFASKFSVLAQLSSNATDLSWHPPNSTQVNNLSSLINGTGVYGFIFNSSTDPAGTPYGTYNWCNMPHVRPQEYPKADSSYKLEYVEVVRRCLYSVKGC